MNPTPASLSPGPGDVLDFWFGDGLRLGWSSDDRHALWFGGGPALDTLIRERFGPRVEQALDSGLAEWEDPIETRLALVLLLDQFTRNVYRGQARAFQGDTRAQRLVRQALDRGLDRSLATVGRVFLYMPLMHAEDLAVQDACVACFQQLVDTSAPELRGALSSNLRFALEHRDIVARFGRFPHRNAALGRASSPEEIAFLEHGPRYGQ